MGCNVDSCIIDYRKIKFGVLAEQASYVLKQKESGIADHTGVRRLISQSRLWRCWMDLSNKVGFVCSDVNLPRLTFLRLLTQRPKAQRLNLRQCRPTLTAGAAERRYSHFETWHSRPPFPLAAAASLERWWVTSIVNIAHIILALYLTNNYYS